MIFTEKHIHEQIQGWKKAIKYFASTDFVTTVIIKVLTV